MHDYYSPKQSSPNRLHSEHALSLTYDDWLSLKDHEHQLATHHNRQQLLRNTVLTLFRRYQADTAYLCWTDGKRRQGCWEPPAPEAVEEAPDVSGYHCRIGSEGWKRTSSAEFLQWAETKQQHERHKRRQQHQQQQQQKQQAEADAKQQHDKAQAEYNRWHTQKQQQLLSQRTLQQQNKLTQLNQNKQTQQDNQQRADELYKQWTTTKQQQQQRQQQQQQRQQQKKEASKKERQVQFEALYPTAIAQYVATVEKWKRDEQAARQRQVDKERVRTGRPGGGPERAVKKEVDVVSVGGAVPSSPMDVQRASSARLAAGKRVEGLKLPFGASTASTAAMSAPSLFDSFSSSSTSSSSLSGPLVSSATAPSTARSMTSSASSSRRARTTKRRQLTVRPAWNDDFTVGSS